MSFGRKRAPEPVFVNVYDLSPGNDYLHPVGLGAYHSGVEVFGVEYSFGSGAGVFAGTPREAAGAKFRESIRLGEVTMSEAEVRAIVDSMRDEFGGTMYNLITRNCNVFSNELSRRLLDRTVPAFINRLAYLGSFVSCLLPPAMSGQAPVDGGAGGGGGGSGGSGGGSAFSARPTAARLRPAAVPVFSGEGRSMASLGSAPVDATSISSPDQLSSAPPSASSRRELLAKAAAQRFATPTA